MITFNQRLRLKLTMLRILVPTWTDLRSYGSSRFLKTSYFWMAFVPIAAKLLSHVPEEVTVLFWEKSWTLNIGLPFSWKVLFFSSLSFSIANAIFSIQCPRIVKDYRTFADYHTDRWSRDRIKKYFIGQNLRAHGNQPEGFYAWFDNASEFFRNHSATPGDFPELSRSLDGIQTFIDYIGKAKIKADHDRQAFYEVLENADGLMEKSRLASWVFYVFGFCLLGLLLTQNVMFVLAE